MGNYEFFVRHGKTADRVLGVLAVAFVAFVAGSFFGYLWMSKAYGLWP